MSKYIERGPYHFIEFCDEKSEYHKHVDDLVLTICEEAPHHKGRMTTLIEVGCGEGLILAQLSMNDFHCRGFDVDREAVRLASHLCPATVDWECAVYVRDLGRFDVSLFSDVLEHLDEWENHLHWAKTWTDMVVIAVPDRHDRHGLRDFSINSFDELFKDWTCVERRTRHARHLLIFKK